MKSCLSLKRNLIVSDIDFIQRTIFPVLRKMGVNVKAKLERSGFYPAGGGKIHITIEAPCTLVPIEFARHSNVRFTAQAVCA